eukprot:gene20345-20257_t
MGGSLKPFLAWTWAGIRRIPRLIAFTLLFGAVGCGAVLSSGEKPANWWTIAGWMEWFFNDQTRAVATLVTAVATAAGLVLSIFQVFFSQAGRQAKAEILNRIDHSRDAVLSAVDGVAAAAAAEAGAGAREAVQQLTPNLQAAVRTAVAEAMGNLPEEVRAGAEEELTRSLGSLFTSRNPEKQSAAALVAQGEHGRAAGVLETLAQRQSTALDEAGRITAETWREIGALRLDDVEAALHAYREAARYDPSNAWIQIFLCRLYQAHGDLLQARLSAEGAVSASDNERDRSCALTAVGDVARQEGDLPGARAAYEDGHVIRKTLTERDPKNTEWQRDLSVSDN